MSFPNNFTGESNAEYTINTIDEKGNNVVQITSEELTIEDGRILLNRENKTSSLQGINIEYYPTGSNLKRYKGILTRGTNLYFPHSKINEPDDSLSDDNLKNGALMDIYMNKLYIKSPIVDLSGNRDLSYNIFSCAGLLSKYNKEDNNGDSLEKGYAYLVQNEGDFYLLKKNEMTPSINENTVRTNLLLSQRADTFLNQINLCPIPPANRKNISGNIYYDGNENVLKYFNGSAWRTLYHTTSTQSADNLSTTGYLQGSSLKLPNYWELNESNSGDYLNIHDQTSNKIRIRKTTGNVLIGQDSDDGVNKLQVNGSLKLTKFKLNDTDGNLSIIDNDNNPNLVLFNSGQLTCYSGTNAEINVSATSNNSAIFGLYAQNRSASIRQDPDGHLNMINFNNQNTIFVSDGRYIFNSSTNQIPDNNTDKLQVNGSVKSSGYKTNNWNINENNNDLVILPNTGNNNPILKLTQDGYLQVTSRSSIEGQSVAYPLKLIGDNNQRTGVNLNDAGAIWTENMTLNLESANNNFWTTGSHTFIQSGNVKLSVNSNGIDVTGKSSANTLRVIPQTQPASSENGMIYYDSTDNNIYGYCNGAYQALNPISQLYTYEINQIPGIGLNCTVQQLYGSYIRSGNIVNYQVGLLLSNPSHNNGSMRIRTPFKTTDNYGYEFGFLGTSDKLAITIGSTVDDDLFQNNYKALKVTWNGSFTNSSANIILFGQMAI